MSLKKGHRLTCGGIDYVLRQTIAGGGAGDVWLAHARARAWAVKVLKPEADKKKIERFSREASFQAGCGHDRIVPVVGRGEAGGRLFYIMPCYPGTLRDVIEAGDADSGTLLSYIQQIGEALQFAHEQGIVHRDVKPENVLVDGSSAALADFGIAHFVDSALTSAGDLIANRDYRAPEQRRGQDARSVGPAADAYALGLIVNECFTRELPAGPSYCSIEASRPLMAYLDPIVARMLAHSPTNRPTIADVMTDLRFFEANKKDEIDDIEEVLHRHEELPLSDAQQFQVPFRRAGEDIWYAVSLIASKTPEQLRQYNGNWHMRLGYDADEFLRNLCVQSRMLDLCRQKFEYESNIYARGDFYKPLDVDGDPSHAELYGQAQALVTDHPLPPEFDLSGRILKTFASCADYHCAETLSDARRIAFDVDENLLDVPILGMVTYLAMYVPNITDVDYLADHIVVNRWRLETFDENEDDLELFIQVHPTLDPEPVLEAFRQSWGVSVTRTSDRWCSVMFRAPDEYRRFREQVLQQAEPQSVFEADVRDLFRYAVRAGGVTQLTLDLAFDVCSTLGKVFGLRDRSWTAAEWTGPASDADTDSGQQA